MKVGILITARLGSTRLEKKHLLPINNKPLLYYLIKRIIHEFINEIQLNQAQLIIATSDDQENRKFEEFSKYGVSVFYGSTNNIPLRHLQVAKAHYIDAILAIDGDDILCSTKGMREIYNVLFHGAPYAKISNLPFGMNSMGYSYSFLSDSIKGHTNDILETGWSRIFNQRKLHEIQMPFFIQNDALRFTLDYEEDYQFLKALILRIGEKIIDASDETIVNVALKEEIYKINEPISKQYWDNFYKIQKQEAEKSLKVTEKIPG